MRPSTKGELTFEALGVLRFHLSVPIPICSDATLFFTSVNRLTPSRSFLLLLRGTSLLYMSYATGMRVCDLLWNIWNLYAGKAPRASQVTREYRRRATNLFGYIPEVSATVLVMLMVPPSFSDYQ